jgi:hypothetical protein
MTLRMDDELWDEVEEARGDVPRERWVRRLVEREVEAQKEAEEQSSRRTD